MLFYLTGALFGFEMLCLILGRVFEPYIVNILPHLLLCFGDNSNFVRQVTLQAQTINLTTVC